MSDTTEYTIAIRMDELDFYAIQKAVAVRQGLFALPDGGGDLMGRVLAEICRGWLELHGRWDTVIEDKP